MEERQVVLHPPAKEINPCCWGKETLSRFAGCPALVGSNGLEPSTSRLSGVRSNHLSYEPISVAGPFTSAKPLHGIVLATVRDYRLPFRLDFSATWQRQLAAGGDEQNRTVDPLLARQVLSQLSYAPVSGLCLGESTLLSSLKGPQN